MSDKELIKILLDIPFESRTLEFKRLGSHNKAIDRTLESIVAMTNIDGGDIFIGVSDPKNTELQGLDRIVGVEENPELLDALGRTIQKFLLLLAAYGLLDSSMQKRRILVWHGYMYQKQPVDSML